MLVIVIPLTSFVHGRINAYEGRPIEIDDSLAGDLERAGLVRVKFLQRRVDQALSLGAGAEVIAGKVPAVGAAVPSSFSPAAPVSRSTTLHLPDRGSGKRRVNGT